MDSIEQLGEQAWRTPSARRICLLVLGMHRSGTSALTRVLSIAGAELPADLMGVSSGNTTGHWESNKLFEYHDRMLAEFNTAWDDWRAIDLSKLSPSRRSEIKTEMSEVLVGQFGDAPLIVVKDPRICRFAPLFFDALDGAGFDCRCVLSFRSPLEVVESLERRDHMPRGEAGLLWLRHVLDAEVATRIRPRALVSYERLLAGWEPTLARLGEQLSVSWPYTAAEIKDQVDAFLSPAQRNHKSTVEEVLLDPMLRGWMAEVYSALLVLEKSPSSEAALANMDRVRREFSGAAPVIDRLLAEAQSRHEAQLQESATALSEACTRGEEANAALVDAREACARLASDIDRRNVEMEALSAEIIEQDNALVRLATDMANSEELINRQQALLHAASQDVEAERARSKQILADTEADLSRSKEALAAYERPSFRNSFVRPLVRWILEGEFTDDVVESEKVVEWLMPSFQSHGHGESWTTSPNGVELAALMEFLNRKPDDRSESRQVRSTRNLLLVSDYAPSFAHAGGLRVRDLYVEIRRINRDLNISLYCPTAPDIDGDIGWLGEMFDEVYLTSPEHFSFIDFVRKSGGLRKYDLVDFQFHRAGRMLSQFSRAADRTLFTPMECLSRSIYEQTRSGLRKENNLRVRDIVSLIRSTLDELRIVAAADETVCVSEADAAFLQKLAPWRQVDSIPTGLSDTEFSSQLAPSYQPTPPSSKPRRLVFAAYFGSETNRAGLAWFMDHVHPHVLRHCPDYKLAVVGRGDLSAFIERKPQGVTFIGEVPVMPPVLEQARAGLVLALHGSGFRGKINQYAVCGLPSISTTLGISGLAYTSGVDIETADDPHEFALSCVRMLNDNEYADELAMKARATALDNYRWDRSHEKIRQIYRL